MLFRIDIILLFQAGLTQAQIDEIEMGAFFSAVSRVDTSRDYTIIVDASGSMWSSGSTPGKTRWDEARAAVVRYCLMHWQRW